MEAAFQTPAKLSVIHPPPPFPPKGLIGDNTGDSSVFSVMISSANDTRRGRDWATGVTASGKHGAGNCPVGAPDDGIESRK